MAKRHFFLSYAREDSAIAAEVRDRILNASRYCWVDTEEIATGANWRSAIGDAIPSAAALLLLVSAASNRSKEVRKEWDLAIKSGVRVLPALIGRRARLPTPLKHLQYTDLRGRTGHAWAELLEQLHPSRIGTAGPHIAATFEMTGRGGRPLKVEDSYYVLVRVHGAPTGTRQVVYHLLDPHFKTPTRRSSNPANKFEAELTTWGDFSMVAEGTGRCRRWRARAVLSDALLRTHKRDVAARAALRAVLEG